MADLIDKQAAIDAIQGCRGCVKALEGLPSAQPEERTETHPCDCISRQGVKEWLNKWEGYIDRDIIARMQYRVIDIPSAQPEVIRCKDCEWWEKQKDSAQGRCELMQMYPTGGWYCGNAQRRVTDGGLD